MQVKRKRSNGLISNNHEVQSRFCNKRGSHTGVWRSRPIYINDKRGCVGTHIDQTP